MKKVLFILLIWLYPLFSFSAINECLTDVYFGNGIKTNEKNATANTLLLEKAIKNEFYNGKSVEMDKHIGKVKEAYNETHSMGLGDLFESLFQKLYAQDPFDAIVDLITYNLLETSHSRNLTTQIESYKESISSGHKVLVVAHSQGNLFADEAYRSLPEWMQNYWEVVSVASPAMFPIKNVFTPSISWDNDVVAWLGIFNLEMVNNPIRNIAWVRTMNTGVEKPISNYVKDTQIGQIYKNVWKADEGFVANVNDKVHAFTFYMGEDLADSKILNPFDGSKLYTDKAKVLILSAIKSQLDKLDEVQSQWITNQEFEKDTCDYKITVKHKYDPSIEMAEKVYPFNGAKKLYQVNGEWVKASCGGENIFGKGHDIPTWDGKQENECYMIDNPDEETIDNQEQFIRFFVNYYISYHAAGDYPFSNAVHSFGRKYGIGNDEINNEYPNDIECSGASESGYGIIGTYPYNDIGLLVNVATQQFTNALVGDDIQIGSSAVYNISSTTECLLNKVNKTLEDITKLETVGYSGIYDFYYGTDTLWHKRRFGEFKLYYK